MSKPTPGPWVAVERLPCFEVVGSNGESITSVTRWVDERENELRANTLLMAAAPELLEALKAMLSYTAEMNANQGFDETDHEAVKQARAAIQKAEGKE